MPPIVPITLALVGGVVLLLVGSDRLRSPGLWAAWLGWGVAFAVCYGVLAKWVSVKPHARDDFAYLEGMKDYIALTDERRLAVMQAADTADRGPDDEIVLYEKLLPYAAVFGLEDTWRERMQGRYAADSPTWLDGDLGATVHSGSDRDWGTSSVPAAGSSSGFAGGSFADSGGGSRSGGGSSGGGSSGGGGGGGGGGGW